MNKIEYGQQVKNRFQLSEKCFFLCSKSLCLAAKVVAQFSKPQTSLAAPWSIRQWSFKSLRSANFSTQFCSAQGKGFSELWTNFKCLFRLNFCPNFCALWAPTCECCRLPFWHYQLVELASSSARVTSVKSAKSCWSKLERFRPIDRTPGIPGSNIN